MYIPRRPDIGLVFGMPKLLGLPYIFGVCLGIQKGRNALYITRDSRVF